MEEPSNWDTKYDRLMRGTGLFGAVVSSVILAFVILHFIYTSGLGAWKSTIEQHPLGTIGLFGMAIFSFSIVTFLRQTEGPIEFEALGMKFKGAAGQVVLWAFCVVVLSLCAKLLW